MRILGFSQKWPKLQQEEFTTFRFPRKDKDWEVGERVQIVYRPRSKSREILGMAQIVDKELKLDGTIETDVTKEEARADGFDSVQEMRQWMKKTYGEERLWIGHMNKLTLRWLPPTGEKG